MKEVKHSRLFMFKQQSNYNIEMCRSVVKVGFCCLLFFSSKFVCKNNKKASFIPFIFVYKYGITFLPEQQQLLQYLLAILKDQCSSSLQKKAPLQLEFLKVQCHSNHLLELVHLKNRQTSKDKLRLSYCCSCLLCIAQWAFFFQVKLNCCVRRTTNKDPDNFPLPLSEKVNSGKFVRHNCVCENSGMSVIVIFLLYGKRLTPIFT